MIFRKNGFTLFETLLAVILLAAGIVPLIWAFNAGMFSATNAGKLANASQFTSSDVESVDLALDLAQAKMEEIKNTAFASIASVSKAAVSNFGSYNQSVTVTSVYTDLKQVDVTIYWTTQGKEINITLSTYVANF